MIKEKTSIGIVTAFLAIITFVFGWTAWNSIEVINNGKDTAALIEGQKNVKDSLSSYQDVSDKKFDKLSDDVSQIKIDSATTKEIMKLVGDRYQINSEAVEARVIRESESQQLSSTTAVK